MARRKIQGGPGRSVQVITDADLKQNGGPYIVTSRLAIPVHGLSLGERKVVGGRYTRVYPVSDAQLASGEYKLAGGSAEALYNIALGSVKRLRTSGRQAIPVYVTSGQLVAAAPLPAASAAAMVGPGGGLVGPGGGLVGPNN